MKGNKNVLILNITINSVVEIINSNGVRPIFVEYSFMLAHR